MLFALRLIIWIVVALLALENLGINVGPLIAGLGVGGIAIALAVQTILGDLFASLSIALDKPFVIGDSLRIDTFEGVVEQIGIKSTRLRSVTGEQIIISNADLLKSRVRNLGRASEWRALFTLPLAYDTPAALIEQVPALVAAAVATYAGTRFVYCLLKQLGESALGVRGVLLRRECAGSRSWAARSIRSIARSCARSPSRESPSQPRRARSGCGQGPQRDPQGEASGVKLAGER